MAVSDAFSIKQPATGAEAGKAVKAAEEEEEEEAQADGAAEAGSGCATM